MASHPRGLLLADFPKKLESAGTCVSTDGGVCSGLSTGSPIYGRWDGAWHPDI